MRSPLLVGLLLAASLVAGAPPKGAPKVAFSYTTDSGYSASPIKDTWRRELQGKVRPGRIDLTLYRQEGKRRFQWKGILRGAAYRECLALLAATRLTRPEPNPHEYPGIYREVKLRDAKGRSTYGVPQNLPAWNKLLKGAMGKSQAKR
jgi:hypothetical protein